MLLVDLLCPLRLNIKRPKVFLEHPDGMIKCLLLSTPLIWVVSPASVPSEDTILLVKIPSGKLVYNYGKSPFLMGKLTINNTFQ